MDSGVDTAVAFLATLAVLGMTAGMVVIWIDLKRFFDGRGR